ncbi:tetratricopeptide repeat protein [Arthrobacter cryoconiti]|uniref:Tetratricopeptide repeat protein n=1 Tax=Arthrobacter cryoconiti TaxID=748907 RepID=A0ABV8QWE5_9MICC|nr:tetratricopeptide repeat protein [Arthrobacter cryoconiti]MCC9069461.1 tetratricopeptide repeat protein [Arthrobacter cryoconiti]
MGLKDWPAAGFPGTAVNPETLLPEVVDEEQCTAALEVTTDAADHVFVLLARGLTSEAAEMAATARLVDPESIRLQVLDAEVLRATRHFDRAERVLKALISSVAGTPVEAWIHQQLGKVYFSNDNFDAAARSFTTALEQRVASGADAAAIYSSTVSLQRALDLAERQ